MTSPVRINVHLALLVSALLLGSLPAHAQNPEVDPAMSGLRNLLYDPGRLKESGIPSASKETVQGVVVEVGMEGTVLMVAGFADGTSRLLLGRGGGVIGEKEDFPAETRSAARALVQSGQSFLAQAPREPARSWPREGHVRFALLTSGGVHAVDATVDSLETGNAPLSPLWNAANNLLGPLIEFMNAPRDSKPPG